MKIRSLTFRSIANWLSVMFLILAIGAVAYRMAGPQVSGVAKVGSNDGKDLQIVDLPGAKGRSAVVVLLSTRCVQCRARAGFYSDLMRGAREAGIGVFAVFPESTSAAEEYMKRMQLDGPVLQAKAGTLTAAHIPAILLIDRRGRVTREWDGLLKPSEQTEVFGVLGIPLPEDDQIEPPMLNLAQFGALVEATGGVMVVDTRPREEFRSGHIANAINIPSDEIGVRAAVELPPPSATPIVLYCRHCDACELSSGSTVPTPPSACREPLRTLRRLGYTHAEAVDLSLQLIATTGVDIDGRTADLPVQAQLWSSRPKDDAPGKQP